MTTKEFAKLAQKVSLLQNGVQKIKINIPDDLKVVFDRVDYYPTKYILQFEDGTGKPLHFAQLHSLNANSVIVVPIEDVERKVDEDD